MTDSPQSGSIPLDHERAMRSALFEARSATLHGDVPVGAVVVVDGNIVARGHNEREKRCDPTAHAELIAIKEAAVALGGWRLENATLVVTLEPCPMCAGALVASRMGGLVFGATDPKAGACGSLYNLCPTRASITSCQSLPEFSQKNAVRCSASSSPH